MTDRNDARLGFKARIMHDSEGKPIQLVLPARAAEALAFITADFAREVVPNSDEAKHLIALAEFVSMRLQDCLVARSPGTKIPERPMEAMAS